MEKIKILSNNEKLTGKMMRNIRFILLTTLVLFTFYMCQPKQEKETKEAPVSGLTIDSIDITHYFPDTLLNRFQDDVDAFTRQDSLNAPAPGQALFVGSSSIRMWDSLQADMQPVPTINRGFGGSTLPELLHYFDQLVLPYQPRVILLYEGENDLATDGAGITPGQVKETFEIFVNTVRAKMPQVEKIYFISIKPSVARWSLWPQMEKANQLIKTYASTQDKVVFVDAAKKMMNGEEVKKDIFIGDNLHMNRKGYALWTEAIKPELVKDFENNQ